MRPSKNRRGIHGELAGSIAQAASLAVKITTNFEELGA